MISVLRVCGLLHRHGSKRVKRKVLVVAHEFFASSSSNLFVCGI